MTTADASSPAQGSFRDPGGMLFRFPDRILRSVRSSHLADLEGFLQTQTARNAEASGSLVTSTAVPVSDFPELDADSLWEHERISFASFPYEWPPEMLHAAASLTLDLSQAALGEGFGIKDATPYNVLFRGPQPVFVDVLSFERRDPLAQTWLAYAQFVRTFLLPLLASREFGLPLDRILTGQRDGLEPETVYRWTGFLKRLTPPFLGLVTLPKWMAGRGDAAPASYRGKRAASPEQARFVLGALYNSLRRQLKAVAPPAATDSTWSGYLDHKSLYSPAQLAQKERFVAEALDLVRPSRVLDVGANEGRFSLLAAKQGAEVVAVDSDPVVVGSIWRKASAENLNVLPLVVDLTRPTPAVGWRNQECPSFLDRAKGGFDLVLMLAVVHHILVTERVPLEDLLALADELSRDYVLIEYVAPADPMFQKIVRGRDELYSGFSPDWFEAAAGRRFELVRSERIDGLHRWLYLFRRRRAAN
ncbi:MAG TPA: class I SAM-dependent methyltransferase [Bryobacteraceae bacterium]|jgi:SAM-dependent methyltransferase